MHWLWSRLLYTCMFWSPRDMLWVPLPLEVLAPLWFEMLPTESVLVLCWVRSASTIVLFEEPFMFRRRCSSCWYCISYFSLPCLQGINLSPLFSRGLYSLSTYLCVLASIWEADCDSAFFMTLIWDRLRVFEEEPTPMASSFKAPIAATAVPKFSSWSFAHWGVRPPMKFSLFWDSWRSAY